MEPGPLPTIRRILLGGLFAGSIGTLLELILVGHDEMAAQLVPLVLLVAGILVSGWALFVPHPAAIRTLQLLMAVFVVSAVCAAAIFGVAVWQARDLMFTRNREISIFAPDWMQQLQSQYHTDSAAVVVARQVWKSLEAFHFGRDMCEEYNIDFPLADPYSAALLLAGFISRSLT